MVVFLGNVLKKTPIFFARRSTGVWSRLFCPRAFLKCSLTATVKIYQATVDAGARPLYGHVACGGVLYRQPDFDQRGVSMTTEWIIYTVIGIVASAYGFYLMYKDKRP
jgi:hypothetical protein